MNFGVSDIEMAATIENMEGGRAWISDEL